MDQLRSKYVISIFLPSLVAEGEPPLENMRKIVSKILTFHIKNNITEDIYGGDRLNK